MEDIKTTLKGYHVVEYDSFSNSGATFYGRKIECIYEHPKRNKDIVFFDKHVSDLSVSEFEKYRESIELTYNEIVGIKKKNNEYLKKEEKYISENIDILQFPIVFYDDYDSFSIFKSEDGIEIKINDIEELKLKSTYLQTHIIFAFKENSLANFGYQLDDYVSAIIEAISL